MTRAKENRAFASFLSIFSSARRSRKSGGSGSAEAETKAAYYYHHHSSGSPTSGGGPGWSPQNQQGGHYWPPPVAQHGRGSTTAFANHRESAESEGSTTPVIPMGSIGVSRGVEITRHHGRSMV